MGSRGFNAGGFAYMPRVTCPRCGLNHVVSNRNYAAGNFVCGASERWADKCRKRAERQLMKAASDNFQAMVKENKGPK